MSAVCSSLLSFTLSGCREYALWVAVVVGAQTGLLHVDATLQGIFHTFMPRLYPYQATSAAQPVLDCFQVKNSFAEDRTASCSSPNFPPNLLPAFNLPQSLTLANSGVLQQPV